ncbi:MAG: siderophore-interacting protein [Pseudomonadota bacterium]
MSNAITDAVVPVANPSDALEMFVRHLKEDHGIALDDREDGGKFLAMDGFRVDFQPRSNGLYVRVEAQNAGSLIFFKEEVAEHVAEIDPTAAENIRWSGEVAEAGSLPPNFKVLKVITAGEVFPGMLRVTLTHEDVASMTRDGIHLRLMMPFDRTRKPVWPRMAANGTPVWPQGDDKLHARFITLRHVRPEDGQVDIDIVRHDGGLISDWALQATAGQTVGVMGPAGPVKLPTMQGLFLAADGTGLPAVARYLELVTEDASGDVVVALPDGYGPFEYLPKSSLAVHTLPPERFAEEIMGRAEDLTEPGTTKYAFFAGEFQNAQDLRGVFKGKLGLDKHTQISTAYWRRGVCGFGS